MKKLLFTILEETSPLGVIWLVLLLCCASIYCWAQPQHAGVLFNGQFETGDTGNGAIYGVEVQNVQSLWLSSAAFKLRSNAQFTREEKNYLQQYGHSLRIHSLLQYEPKSKGFFVEAGAQYGQVVYTNQYRKDLWRPLFGVGYTYSDKAFSVLLDYQYQMRRPIYGAGVGTNQPHTRFVDGYSNGQQFGMESTLQLGQSKWLLLTNAKIANSVYQRNTAVYGTTLGAVKHHATETEFSLGIGRKY